MVTLISNSCTSLQMKLVHTTGCLGLLNVLIFLGDGYDSIGSLQWRSSGSDSLPLCFGYFPTSYMKNNCMKNSLNFLKTVWCNKIWKTTFVNAIIHHHVLQWFSPFILTAILVYRST